MPSSGDECHVCPPRPRPAVCSSAIHTPHRWPCCAAANARMFVESTERRCRIDPANLVPLIPASTKARSSPITDPLVHVSGDAHAEISGGCRMRQSSDRDEVHASESIFPYGLQVHVAGSFDRNTGKRRPYLFDRLLHFSGRHVIQQNRFCPASDGLLELRLIPDLNLDDLACLVTLESLFENRSQPSPKGDVIVFDKNPILQVQPVINSSSAAHGIFVEDTQTWNRLACIQNLCLCLRYCADKLVCQRGDTAHPLHQVQDHPLGREQRGGVVADYG